MLTCKSPRKVMRAAFRLARDALPAHSCKFSRRDFTLPQLFACLVAKEHTGRTYRGAEALLRDCFHWLRDVGLCRAPDHNTLWRAASFLLAKCRVDRLLDAVARWAALARALGLSLKPLAIDGTYFEPRHVSRHYERRLREARKAKAAAMRKRRAGPRARQKSLSRGKKRGRRLRSAALKRLPKLTLAVAGHCHLALSLRASTGAGSDCPDFVPLLRDARRRVPNKCFKVAADSGSDSEPNHLAARRDMGLVSLIPPDAGRPRKDPDAPPGGRWRRHMGKLLATKASRKRCGYTQRWQVETAISMIKRNLGSALRGKTARSRRRDMALKALTHDVMILPEMRP